MNARINQLVKSLLQKDSLEQCSLSELQQFADRHPYFGAAQLLLTKKLQEEKSDQYDHQLQKTYLFFHNPLWVEHLLNDTGSAIIRSVPEEKEVDAVSVLPGIAVPAPEIIEADTAVVENNPETSNTEKIEITGITEEASPDIPGINEPEPALVEMTEIQAAAEPVEQPAEAAPVQDSVTDTDTASPEIMNSLVNPALTDPLMEIPAFKMEQTVQGAGSTNELVFEPFHTVDYFASQGIRFKEEERPKDKFGIQLKSFTDWLKTMKRLPQAEINKNPDTATEHKVNQLAENSLQEREIVTEAMAEVWEKQGNYAKAIIVYHKLSLLEPAKSLYFAAKIEDLKKLN